MTSPTTKDLVVLVADKDAQRILTALLQRPRDLGLRELSFDVFPHVHHDPACMTRAHDFLRPHLRAYDYALVCFDHEGSGAENRAADEVERGVKKLLETNGWRDRCAVFVFEPEIEAWIWINSAAVVSAFGWRGNFRDLKSWLMGRGQWEPDEHKPSRPKEAVEMALKQARRARSSSLYERIARDADPGRCSDRQFNRFRTQLQQWFGMPV